MNNNPQDILNEIFGSMNKPATQPVTQQPTIPQPLEFNSAKIQTTQPIPTTVSFPSVQTTQKDIFSTFQEMPSTDQQIINDPTVPWDESDEPEEIDEIESDPDIDDIIPNNTFSLNIPGFETKTEAPKQETSGLDLSAMFATSQGSELITPPVKRGRGRPKGSGVTVSTPQDVANQIPFNLNIQENQKSTGGDTQVESQQIQQTGANIVLSLNAEKVLQIAKGLQIIANAIETIANSKL